MATFKSVWAKITIFWLPKYVRGIMEAEGRVEQETIYRDLRGRGKRAAEGDG